MLDNIIKMTDSYKVSHYRQYPPGTTQVYSYMEARKGGEFPEVVFFGLQYFLKRYFEGVVVTASKIDQAEQLFNAHFGDSTMFNRKGWEIILNEHDGRLPIRIKAAPEGMVIPEANVLFTVENTCPKVPWLVNYLETILVQTWYPITTATISREMRKILNLAMKVSGGDPSPDNLDFRLHDFGYRGSTSPESAALGGASHLVNFKGTDTIAAIEMLMEYYGAEMPGFSIPAAEHSTITSWGRAREAAAYENMLKQYPTGLVAVVSDSYDIYNAIRNIWGDELRDQVIKRDGCLVVRPDSGDPSEVLVKMLNIMGSKFDFTINDRGYKVLPSYIRLIQGDGIKRTTLKGIIKAVIDSGWSSENLIFGSGGGLMQDCNRDTQRMALKCAAITVDGVERPVYKNPITDSTKRSKSGRMLLARDDIGILKTFPQGKRNEQDDLLQTVFENGNITVDHNLKDIRKRAAL